MAWVSNVIRKLRIRLLIFGLVVGFGLIGCSEKFAHDAPASSRTIEIPSSQTPSGGTLPVTPTAIFPVLTNLNEEGNSNHVDGARLVSVPAGTLAMGADAERSVEICDQFRDDCTLDDFMDEEPVHLVELDPYWIYEREVTNANYRLCVLAGNCSLPAFTDFYNNPEYADHPAVYVSWTAADTYCKWAGGRLPTEAEWEKAARGSDGRIFPWGSEEVGCEFANFSGCSIEMTAPAGISTLGASPYGALDMAGNVSEWVADWYDPHYYQISALENPTGPETGEMKVIRGGSWKNLGVGLRSTNRGANFPEVYSTGVGFRCVLDSE